MPQQRADHGEISADVDDAAEPAHEAARPVEVAGAGHGGRAAGGVEQVLDALQPDRRRNRVGVEPCEDVTCCRVEPGDRRRQDAANRLRDDARTASSSHVGTVVGAAVVDDDDLVGGPGLRGQRIQTRSQHDRVVEDGDHDGN